MNKAIGILGGTFDPIHLGHLQLAKEVYQHLHLQEVRFIPTYIPVHRHTPIASAKDRLQMVKLATDNQPGMLADDREIHRQGPSYMIDTLKSIKQETPESSLYLIMADDAFADFNNWFHWQEILNYAHIIVANRSGTALTYNAQLQQFLQKHQIKNPALLTEKRHGYIYFIEIPALTISGTDIRQKIAAGSIPKKELPSAVWKFIEKNKLYTSI